MIKAIETVYAGYRFRSRLEARWAVFFDTLDIKYDYEPEGFDLDGVWYLPDFYLLEQDCWVEVKRQHPTEQEIQKAKLLAEQTRKHVFILFGDLAPLSMRMDMIDNEPGDLILSGARGHSFLYRERKGDVYFSDTFHMFGECSSCHSVAISFWGYTGEVKERKEDWTISTNNDCCCGLASRDDYKSPRLIAAYTAARQARFEHGEKG